MGRKYVRISLELFQQICTQGWKAPADGMGLECVEGLPENARLVGSGYSAAGRSIELLFESPDWPKAGKDHGPEHLKVVWRSERLAPAGGADG